MIPRPGDLLTLKSNIYLGRHRYRTGELFEVVRCLADKVYKLKSLRLDRVEVWVEPTEYEYFDYTYCTLPLPSKLERLLG